MVVGVIAGPGTIACIQRGDFSQCMSETFFGGEPVRQVQAEAPAQDAAAAEEAGPAGETVSPPAEPEEVEAAPAVEPVPPTIALVRVEPDGSAVIAGTATPSGGVRIFADADEIGSETAQPSGDWAFVTAEPLPAGGIELRVLDVETELFASTSVVVVVQDDRASEPLVVAFEPGEASEILQGLDRPAPVAAPEPEAAPEPAPEPEPASQPEAEPAPIEDAPAEEPAPAIASAPEPVVEPELAPQAPAIEEAPLQIAQTEEPRLEPEPEPQPAPEPQPEPATPAAAPASEEPAPAQQPALPAGETTQVAVAEEPAPAATEPVTATEPAPVIVPPTIDAVEIDGDRNFFAGGGTDGLTVRLYVDNRPVGSDEVADDRWLVETTGALTQPSQRVRVDMIGPDGAVVGRAEVDFVLDLPEPEPTPEPEPVIVAETPEPEAPAAPAPVEEPAPVAETPEEAPVGEAVPTMVGVTEGDRTTSGLAIIRRGDNLWTIARRVYGEGVRYTQIYEANTDQIRDPDLIYPGQVFDLPETDLVIGAEEAGEE